jgi:diguanylate cyclase (GGDEF)-like protein
MASTISEIAKSNDGDTEIYKVLAPLIVATLAPSIASSMNDELATISYELRNSPESLSSQAMQKEIKQFIKKRVGLDKEEVKKKISLLHEISDEINTKILTLMDVSDISNEQVKGSKQDSFESLQNRLIQIASSLETATKDLSLKMSENKKTINNLHTKVEKLENSLFVAKKESKEDFLTHVATKDALIVELKRAEEAYARYKIDYTVCFLDIDHFKVINGTYGHDAGDVILATFGKILTHYVREVDFAGRYGGDKFLVILPGVDLVQGLHFAEKMRAVIENYKFIYKNERINITISCGVAQRGQSTSAEDTVIDAEKMLYKAKESGRNQVMPKH